MTLTKEQLLDRLEGCIYEVNDIKADMHVQYEIIEKRGVLAGIATFNIEKLKAEILAVEAKMKAIMFLIDHC